ELAVETGLFPVFEMEDGEITSINKISDRKPVREWLEKQGRFKHLFKDEEKGEEAIEELQSWIDDRAEDLGLDA
ncbi:MAG: pyruvate ferredoxin oxidoreductase, partial [Halorhabdus sp.]